jgi:hypothetical protein
MPSTQSARLLTLALVVFVSLTPALARADGPRVVVLPFEGAEAVSTRLVVYEALEAEGVELTSLAAAGEAARAARVRGLSRRRVGRVLAIADADAALQGRTTVARDRVLVRLVLSTASGRVLYDREVAFEDARSAARALREALSHGASEPEPPPRAAASSGAQNDTPPWERGADPAPSTRAGASSTAQLPWLVAGIGASARMRDAAFEADDGTRFHRAWYPTIDLAAELRPFHTARGLERGLFVRAAFHHSVGLRSVGPNDTVVDTAFWGLGGDAGLLVTVAEGWDLGFAVGLGVDAFELADTPATLVPTAVYGSLRPGLRLRTQLLDELVVLDIGASYRWIFDRGPIGAAFGRQGESHGFELGASLGGSVDVGFSWALSAELVGVVHQLHGEADVVPASDGRDLGLRFGARVGLALR